MIAGSARWPAVASSVRTAAARSAVATVDRMAPPARPRGRLVSHPSSSSIAYTMTHRGKPPCQNMNIQAVLWGPAPRRPVDANKPGNVSMWEIAMTAVNR